MCVVYSHPQFHTIHSYLPISSFQFDRDILQNQDDQEREEEQ